MSTTFDYFRLLLFLLILLLFDHQYKLGHWWIIDCCWCGKRSDRSSTTCLRFRLSLQRWSFTVNLPTSSSKPYGMSRSSRTVPYDLSWGKGIERFSYGEWYLLKRRIYRQHWIIYNINLRHTLNSSKQKGLKI